MKQVSPITKRIALGVLVVVVILLGISTVYRAGPYQLDDVSGHWEWGSKKHRTDFSIYTEVGQAVLDGKSIYQVENPRGWHYNNAPVFGLLFIPFSLMPMFFSSLLWYLLTLGVFAYGLVCAVRLAREGMAGVEAFWMYLIPLVLLASPSMSALARGQTTPLMFGFAMAGIYSQSRGRSWWGGALFSGAILLKIFPVLLLPYFVWQRRWKFLSATMVWLILGTLVIPALGLGWKGNIETHREWVSILQRPTFSQGQAEDPRFAELISPELIRNQSLQSVLKRLTGMTNANVPAGLAGLLMAGMMAWAAWRSRGQNRMLLLSALIAWTLLMSPVSWNHYFMLLALPLAVLTAQLASEEKRSRSIALFTLILFALINLVLLRGRVGYWPGPFCWGALVVWSGLMLLALQRPSNKKGCEPSVKM